VECIWCGANDPDSVPEHVFPAALGCPKKAPPPPEETGLDTPPLLMLAYTPGRDGAFRRMKSAK
jgi:hypothetical protein